ncbi:MAG: TetR/AcrR family transcriptional regulator [Mucilaginibacter sp.]
MPRVQLFDKEKALKNAMELFWKKGFNGTSTRDLEKATGLGTSSIYNSFGGKEALFFETLQYYMDAEQLKLGQNIKDSPSALKALRALLECVMEEGGCFVVNSITELANENPRLNEFVTAARAGTITILKELIQKAQAQDEIPAGSDPAQLAVYLQTVMTGLKVSGMVAKDPKELLAVIALTMQNLTKK